MYGEPARSRVVIVFALSVLLLSSVAVSAAGPSIKIQIKKNAPSCTSPGDCEIYVRDRGVGVCGNPRSDASGTYCYDGLEWDLIGKGQLTANHVVLILWSPKSSPDSDTCLNQQNYVLTTANATAQATVQANPKCTGKMTWLYDVVLLYNGTEIDRDDPGVLIED